MKRLLGPLLLGVLVIGVGAAIFLSANQQIALRQVVTVNGLIGSEKEPFFKDTRVIDALRKGGIAVTFDKAGSRTIATTPDLSKYDFVFPSGVPAATKLRQDHKSAKTYDEFFTPMAIASWKSIASILEANGLAKNQGGYYTLDMAAYLQMVTDNKRWTDLKNNADYNINKSILITSTDVRQSNSAAMYLALASYVANGNNVIQSDADIQKVLPIVEPLFLKQGFSEYSSEVPFQDYLSMGVGKAPMVMIYEAQYIAQAAIQNGITSDMVLMYPEPTIYSKHILVALTPNGQKLGELLQNDPDLQRLAVENGFRNSNVDLFKLVKSTRNLTMPDSLVNVVDPPSYEILEKTIQQIEQKYTQ
ncbi:MAG TPA: hypothetical protein VMS73_09745 [Anaerolineaceae bacterium]|nr:hypothetical protein [Anaerolineaceae bacterium]